MYKMRDLYDASIKIKHAICAYQTLLLRQKILGKNLDLRKLSYFIHDLTSTFTDEVIAILHDTSTILELDRMKII